VADEGLDAASDRSIWEWAGERGFVVVSKDTDFRQLAFLYGPPPKVVWLRVGNVSTSLIETLLLGSASRIARFIDDDEEALLVISPAD
jgi:predicted nuclease of predicted toxin-antitoxin system